MVRLGIQWQSESAFATDTGATSDKSVVINGLFVRNIRRTARRLLVEAVAAKASPSKMGKNGYGIVGAFGGVAGGVATSTDGGKMLQASAVSVLDKTTRPLRRTQATRRGTSLVRGPQLENFGSDGEIPID